MPSLHHMSYAEFGKLKFLDFFPRTEDFDEGTAGFVGAIGQCYGTGYGFTRFCSPKTSRDHTAEIGFDLSQDDCPVEAAHALLDHLGLPLRKGMSLDIIKANLGDPESESFMTLRYVIGQEWPYYLNLVAHEGQGEGLYDVSIVRKDLADKAEAEGF